MEAKNSRGSEELLITSKSTGRRLAPIAIGGIGGSGTRIVAQLLRETGFYIGADLNESNDNLWFTLLFKRPEILSEEDGRFGQLVGIFAKAMQGSASFTARERGIVSALASVDRLQHSSTWLRERAQSLLAATEGARAAGGWGWKEPNTHIVIDRLLETFPTLKYIHVIRNGLDMAYSSNQNQLQLWGPLFLGEDAVNTPRNSLRFWRIANQRVIDFFAVLPGRFLLLNFDRLCRDPGSEIARLLNFAGKDPEPSSIRQLVGLLRAPQSIGRFKREGLGEFDPADVEYVRHLGFDTDLS